MTENIPNLRKEIDIQVQQGQRVPNKLKPKRHTQRYITIKMAKVKDRERILQAAREKQLAIYEGKDISFLADFSVKNLLQSEGSSMTHSKCWEGKISNQNCLPNKVIIQNWRRDQGFPR